MNKVDAVFYDLDNTLYRQLEDVRQRIAYCARKFRLPDAVEILSFWLKEWSERGPAERNYIDKVIERFSLKVDREAMIEEYRSCTTTLSLDEKVYDFSGYGQGARDKTVPDNQWPSPDPDEEN